MSFGNCGGMMVSDRTRPTASARGQPKVISAWRFHSAMRPSALMATKASWALSRMRRRRSSLVRSAPRPASWG